MAAGGVDALLLSHGADLPWLTGYTAMPLERPTVLVLPADGDAVLVVPELEAPRVPPTAEVAVAPWAESDDPIAAVARLVPRPRGSGRLRLGVSERMWASTLLHLQATVTADWVPASAITGPLRAVKDAAELAALRAAAAAADQVAAALAAGEIELVGRTEADVSAELGQRLVGAGHQRVNFAIVGSGPNGASPHHEAGDRLLRAGDVVVCDFGGTLVAGDDVGYCSDITRTLSLGPPSAEVAATYAVLQQAQAEAVAAVRPGIPAEAVDAAARQVIADAGLGDRFIHRTGHGIGIEEHEDPYVVAGNRTELVPGHTFSVEPGIYLPGRFGMRLEDIVAVTEDGVEPLNRADHALIVLDV
jgi:Xaa-Pro aminopeptidase